MYKLFHMKYNNLGCMFYMLDILLLLSATIEQDYKMKELVQMGWHSTFDWPGQQSPNRTGMSHNTHPATMEAQTSLNFA